MLFSGPCDARPNAAAAVCVRQRDGSWRELGGASPTSADAGTPAPTIARWVPTPDGGALGLVGGAASGVYDAATAVLTPFTTNPRPQEHLLFNPPHQLLVDDVATADDGRLVGYLGSSSFTLTRDGQFERSPQRFNSLQASGALALSSLLGLSALAIERLRAALARGGSPPGFRRAPGAAHHALLARGVRAVRVVSTGLPQQRAAANAARRGRAPAVGGAPCGCRASRASAPRRREHAG